MTILIKYLFVIEKGDRHLYTSWRLWKNGIVEKWKNGKDKLQVAGCEFKVTKCRWQVMS